MHENARHAKYCLDISCGIGTFEFPHKCYDFKQRWDMQSSSI